MTDIIRETRENMRSQFRLSRSMEFMNPGRAKSFGLVEHYYSPELDDNEVKEAWEKVESCLAAFGNSSYREDVQNAERHNRFCYIEKPGSGDFGHMSAEIQEIGDFRVFAHPDCVITQGDETVTIYDWKTGRAPEEDGDQVTFQLILYALWLKHKYGIDATDGNTRIEAYEVYWPNEEYRGDIITPDHVENAIQYAKSSVADMKACLVDPDKNEAQEKDFEAAASPGKCAVCEYREVCDDKVIEQG